MMNQTQYAKAKVAMNRRTFVNLVGSTGLTGQVTGEKRPSDPSTIGGCSSSASNCAVMDGANARFKVDLETLLDRHDMEWKHYLPGDWYDGAPLGNGDLGAMVFGYPDSLGIVLSKGDVWDRSNDDQSYFPGKNYAEFKRTYLDQNWQEHQRLESEAASRRKRKTLALPHLTTCGTLVLRLDGGIKHSNVKMNVSLRRGQMSLKYIDRTVRALTSRRYGVLLVDIDRGAPETEPADPVRANRYGTHPPFQELPWELFRSVSQGNPRARCRTEDQYHFLTQRFRAGGEYTVGVALTPFSGSDAKVLPGRITGNADGPKARRCQVYVAIVSSQDAADTKAECKRRLERAVSAGADAVIADHEQWWRDYWMRGLATVGDRAVEKWYYVSLYLCGALLEPGRQTPGLQGIWCGEDFPRWCGDYHSNVNIQAIYWGLLANNRLDLMEPYLSHFNRTAGHARAVARDYYQMRGLRFPHMGSIGGHELSPPNMLGTDPCGTPWVAQLFWQYYQYTRDRRFLREVAYPILRDAALFCSDFLTPDKQAGQWTIVPVVHFEVRRYSANQRGVSTQPFEMWGANSLYAQAMFRLAFNQAIRAAQVLGVDEDHQREWRDKLEHLVPPPVTQDGYWKAWGDCNPVYGWHNFLLPLVFPAELVSQFHGPREWLEQARATWRHLKESGLPSNTGLAWCGGQGISEILRIGEVDEAFRGARWPAMKTNCRRDEVPIGMLVRADEQQENGLSVSRLTPVLQVDHGPGMCRVLAEMLVLGLDGIIRLFAGIPSGVPARFLSLRAPGGFLITAEKRNEVPDYVLIRATQDETLRLANPWRGPAIVRIAESNQTIHATEAELIELKLEGGREYLITSAGHNADRLPIVDFALPTGSV